MSDSDNSLQPGSTFGKHRIVRLLGRGGMGEVYEVEHELTGKRHALKLLSADVMEVSGALERFEREAKVMARLEHPGIVRVDDSGDTEGRHWLRMELMPGREGQGKRVVTLEEYVEVKGGRLPEFEVKKLTYEILEALGHAHGQGLVHRDLKPANVLLDGERLKIADFGLVNAAGADWMDTQVRSTVINQDEEDTLMDDGSGTGSRSRAIMGTYSFMSPEQKKGQTADARSDLYAVGLMVFRMLTGEESPGFKLPSRIIKDIDPGWDDWVERCMETNPADRFPNAGEMKDALSFKKTTVPPASTAKPARQPSPERELPSPVPVAKPQAPVRKAPVVRSPSASQAVRTGGSSPQRSKPAKRKFWPYMLAIVVVALVGSVGVVAWILLTWSNYDDGEIPAEFTSIDFGEDDNDYSSESAFSGEIISLVGGTSISWPQGQAWVDPGYTAAFDGNDVTPFVEFVSFVDVNIPGIYKVVYTVRVDDFGDVIERVDRVVTIIPVSSWGVEPAQGTELQAKKDRDFIDRLRRDPDFQDATARKELGYGENDERLYRMPDVSSNGIDQSKSFTVSSIGMDMLWVNPGSFRTGDSYDDYQVTLTKGFYLGKHEVTQAQWERVMGNNPSYFKGADRPVEKVSWNDAVAFCKKLTEKEKKAGRVPQGMAYQLPTEAQWEYACRAGTTTKYSWGDTITKTNANYAFDGFGTGLQETTPVGSYPANRWGFHDMHGNVWEWCADWYGDYPSGAVRDPVGPADGSYRVLRGGSWSHTALNARCALRIRFEPAISYSYLGFRLSLRPVSK